MTTQYKLLIILYCDNYYCLFIFFLYNLGIIYVWLFSISIARPKYIIIIIEHFVLAEK